MAQFKVVVNILVIFEGSPEAPTGAYLAIIAA
jgi:hypothetical protein